MTPEYFSSLAPLLSVGQLDKDCVMSQIFKLFLLDHNNIIIHIYLQLYEHGMDYHRTRKTHLLS